MGKYFLIFGWEGLRARGGFWGWGLAELTAKARWREGRREEFCRVNSAGGAEFFHKNEGTEDSEEGLRRAAALGGFG